MSRPSSIFSKCCFRSPGFAETALEYCCGGRAAACSVRANALASAGGIASIRNALIDDCSLAAKLKTIGPIWLGLDRSCSRSIRPYDTLSDVKRMISRSAYAQLRYSPLLLAATVAAMALTFIAPPLLGNLCHRLAAFLGLIAWLGDGIVFIHTDAAVLSAIAILEPCLAGNCRRSTCITRFNSAYDHIREGGAVSGRGAFTLMRRACNDPQRRTCDPARVRMTRIFRSRPA